MTSATAPIPEPDFAPTTGLTEGQPKAVDPLAMDALFDIEAPPPISLRDRFGVPPFSILDRRGGPWQDRRRQWLTVGIQSEVGRDAGLTWGIGMSATPDDWMAGTASTTSIFDPVICELVYRWFAGTGQHVLDPFAGGSVRGIAAALLGRHYTGIDLRAEQIDANRAQLSLLTDDMPTPTWIAGDSAEIPSMRIGMFDLIFSCPPYADLEVYSDDPRDLSTMKYPDFEEMHGLIIAAAAARLRNDRFAAWVISDVRDKGTPGSPYHGLVADTVRAFERSGLRLYNDAIILDNVGSGAMRAAKVFQQSRKLVRMHQHLLVFVKGDPKAATLAAGGDL